MKLPSILLIAVVVFLGVGVGCHSSGAGTMSDLRLRIDNLDLAPEELGRQAPFECTLVRVLRGPDRPDYMLFALSKPLDWKGRKATHVVLAARLAGTSIQRGIRDLPVGIAIVTDPALQSSGGLRFDQVDYAAIGYATDVGESNQ